jgi:hypothetical protein
MSQVQHSPEEMRKTLFTRPVVQAGLAQMCTGGLSMVFSKSMEIIREKSRNYLWGIRNVLLGGES